MKIKTLRLVIPAFTFIICLMFDSFTLAQTQREDRQRQAEETRQIHRELTLPSGQPRPEPRVRRKAPARKKTPPAKNRRR